MKEATVVDASKADSAGAARDRCDAPTALNETVQSNPHTSDVLSRRAAVVITDAPGRFRVVMTCWRAALSSIDAFQSSSSTVPMLSHSTVAVLCSATRLLSVAMPKKLNSNPKAVEARERKDAVKKERTGAAVRAAEDAKWADEGQSAAEVRAAEKERKRLEELKKKEQKKAAEARDHDEMKAVKTVKVNPHKVAQTHTHTRTLGRACHITSRAGQSYRRPG